jgi:hypothetical protein
VRSGHHCRKLSDLSSGMRVGLSMLHGLTYAIRYRWQCGWPIAGKRWNPTEPEHDSLRLKHPMPQPSSLNPPTASGWPLEQSTPPALAWPSRQRRHFPGLTRARGFLTRHASVPPRPCADVRVARPSMFIHVSGELVSGRRHMCSSASRTMLQAMRSGLSLTRRNSSIKYVL